MTNNLDIWKIFIALLIRFGPSAIIVIVICLIIYFWTRIGVFLSSIANFFQGIFNVGKSQAIRLSIQSQINQAIMQINDEIPGLFENGVRVRWLSEGDEHINIIKKGIYIRVKEIQNIDNIYLKSLSFMMENGLLINSKEYIHGHIMQGIKLVLSEKMLLNSGFKSALISYKKNTYNPTIAFDKSIESATNKLEYLDYQGLFTRVFLRECNELASIVGLGHESSRPKWDVTRFLDFTHNLFSSLNKEYIRTEFEYSSPTINIAFAVLADEYTWETRGLGFYKRRTLLSIRRGANTIYIIAIGKRNIQIANNLSTWLRSEEILDKRFISNYNFNFAKKSNLSAICIRCEIKPLSRQKEIIQEQKVNVGDDIIVNDQSLHDYIKNIIHDSDIEIVKSAWIKGYQAQVVVNSKNRNKNPLRICIGKNGINAQTIQQMIGDDFVRYIQWSPDIREAILNNLDNHEKDEIHDISLDPINRIAFITVNSENTIKELIGVEGKTQRIAEALTEYSIDFQVDPKSKLIDALSKVIPEIKSKEIKVLDLATVGNEEVRILVSSDEYSNPAQICGIHLEEIKREIVTIEKFYFCNKKEGIEKSIIASLYPLKEEEVVEVIMESTKKYIVVVNNHDAISRSVGINGIHVRAASKLLGIGIRLITPDEK